MPVSFREDRTTQAAARFLKRRGGRMSYMKLLKLLYLADRQALAELGRPITFDMYFSLGKGPILSLTKDLMTSEPDPAQPRYWHQLITPPEHFEVALRAGGAVPNDQLSAAEESIIDRVFDEFGRMGRWELVEYTHSLPEYRDPGSSALPISIREVLRAQGVSEEEAVAIEEAIAAEALIDQLSK